MSIEDPFDEEDWAGYAALTASVSIQIVGDDLLCTNPRRIQKAIDGKNCNALLLKVVFYILARVIAPNLFVASKYYRIRPS